MTNAEARVGLESVDKGLAVYYRKGLVFRKTGVKVQKVLESIPGGRDEEEWIPRFGDDEVDVKAIVEMGGGADRFVAIQ